MMPYIIGLPVNSLIDAKKLVDEILTVPWTERDSLYHGGVYFAGKLDGQEITIENNFDLIDEEVIYADHLECRFFVSYDGTSSIVLDALTGLEGSVLISS